MRIRWVMAPAATAFQYEYLNDVVFSKVPHESVIGAEGDLGESAISIYSSDDRYLPNAILVAIKQSGSRIIYHLSGQQLHQYLRYYRQFDVILRSHYDPRVRHGAVFFLPLGFKSGFLTVGDVPAEKRDIVWTFAGMPKNHRAEMIAAFEEVKPNFIHLTSDWESSDTLSVAKLKALYRRTLFVPCPFGNINPDTFRVMEALEQGAIPVSVLFNGIDYFKYIYGDHPFVIGTDWIDAQRQMVDLVGDPQRLTALLEKTAAWYAAFKEDLSNDVANIVAGRSSRLVSRQFVYQREGVHDSRLKAVFGRHFGRPMDHPVVHRLIYPLRIARRIVRSIRHG